MAQPQQPESPLLEQFKEQLRKLAEEAGPIECLNNELYRFNGILFDAAYMCDELVFLYTGPRHEFTVKALDTAMRGVFSMLRLKYRTEAFSLIPPGLAYILYESSGQPNIAAIPPITVSFRIPASNLFTQFDTAEQLIIPFGDLGSEVFNIINRKDVYMLLISVNGNMGFFEYYAFGLAKDLRDDVNSPFAYLIRKDAIDRTFIGLTVRDFTGSRTTTLPAYLDWEIASLQNFLTEAIANSRLAMWSYREAGSNQLTLQAYTPPQVKKQEVKK
jgi:hypothetical protein